ncbi:retrovirus-related pol polyprotein from transposon TNT 1-94 [Tanacetum coccineum]
MVNSLGKPKAGVTTRSRYKDSKAASTHECLYVNFLSEIKPKKWIEALEEEGWVIVMREELNQFERNKVWTLVSVPYGKKIIKIKWIFKNKMDKSGVVIKNKARLVAQGFSQQDGIDYDETFSPVARLEAIRIFLAYTAYMGFVVHQMDVKSAFLNRKIAEEVYIQQLPGFESSEFPNHIKQDFKVISIFQEKYVRDLLKKYDLADSALMKCPMLPPNNLGHDKSGVSVNETLFRGMIGSLMYLTASRPDIQFCTCLYARGCQILGGNLVCWTAKKQSSIAMSSAEAEYVVVAGCCAQVLWIKMLHSRTKHSDIISLHQDHTLKCDIDLHFVPADMQLADIFTKPLAEPSFTRLVAELGMLNIKKEVPDKKKALSDHLT